MKRFLAFMAVITIFLSLSAPVLANETYETRRFYPLDQGRYIANFNDFRVHLVDIVEQKNTEKLLEIIPKDIHFSFGAETGKDAFIKSWELDKSEKTKRNEQLWYELKKVLDRGGAFYSKDTFEAPYYYAKWPTGYDAYSFATVLGENVNIYSYTGNTLQPIETLTYNIVKMDMTPGWEPIYQNGHKYMRIMLPNGKKAYISDYYLGSPIGFRAIFSKNNSNQWKMTVFIAGD